MVIDPSPQNSRRNGSLMLDLLVALGLLSAAVLPLAYSIASEARAARGYYQRAVAMEIVDGEFEILLAGEWRAFEPGEHLYPIRARSAANLPEGQLILTREARFLRLEWKPSVKQHGGPVVREAALP